jgi:hypothetical protein
MEYDKLDLLEKTLNGNLIKKGFALFFSTIAFSYCILNTPITPPTSKVIAEYSVIKKKLNNLDFLYKQPVTIGDLINKNYSDSLKTLKNKLLVTQDSITSLPLYKAENEKYNRKSKLYAKKMNKWGVYFSISSILLTYSFALFPTSLYYSFIKKKRSKK